MEKPLNKDFIEKFKINQLKLKAIGSWIISLRPQQPTIGSLVLTLNRSCPSLSELSTNEAKDLSECFKEIEFALNREFNPQKFNYLALMMYDEQVHFHVIPRYESNIEINNELFIDKAWPGPPSLEPLVISKVSIEIIYDRLVSAFN
jgi:diadenosine tetraphosphate (Ap4A) HIT family hydrolase